MTNNKLLAIGNHNLEHLTAKEKIAGEKFEVDKFDIRL